MKKITRNTRRKIERETIKMNIDIDVFYHKFYDLIFNANKHYTYNDIFNYVKSEFIRFAKWANIYKYKHVQIDTMSFHENFKSVI